MLTMIHILSNDWKKLLNSIFQVNLLENFMKKEDVSSGSLEGIYNAGGAGASQE